MTYDSESRARLAAMLRSAGAFGLRDQGFEDDFIRGAVDPQLSDLGIDSLAEMELCIAIENEMGVSIIPAELGDLSTLGGLLHRIVGIHDSVN